MSAAPSSPMPPKGESSPGSAFGQRVIEYFTLREAEAALARLPELSRAAIADGIELARQQAAAAEALFAVGHTVEALRLAREALETTQVAAERYAGAMGLEVGDRKGAPAVSPASDERADDAPATGATAEPAKDSPSDEASSDEASSDEASSDEESPASEASGEEETAASGDVVPAVDVKSKASGPAPAWRQLAARAGMSTRRIEGMERQLAAERALSVPRLEKDVAPAHVDGFREVIQVRAAIEETLAPATHTKGSLLGARIWRGVSSTVVLLVVLAGLVYAFKPVEGTFVRASATWADSPDFRPDFVIDGNEDTMWLLPDNAGWVEVRTAPAIEAVHRITLVNAGNARVNDRGTRVYRIEIYSGGELVESIDGEFGDELGATATHEVSAENVERIRFVAVSGYRVGAGLSELRWE